MLDLHQRLTDARLTRMVNDLRTLGHLNAGAFQRLCAQSRRVDRLLGGDGGDGDRRPQRATRSWLEDMFRCSTERHRLPMSQIKRDPAPQRP